MDIHFLDVAQDEFDEAVEYYNEQAPGLGDEFLLEVLSTLERIRRFSNAWQPYTKNSRRCQTRRFPYAVAYQIRESEILVIAIAHLHRRPGYWLDLIKQ